MTITALFHGLSVRFNFFPSLFLWSHCLLILYVLLTFGILLAVLWSIGNLFGGSLDHLVKSNLFCGQLFSIVLMIAKSMIIFSVIVSFVVKPTFSYCSKIFVSFAYFCIHILKNDLYAISWGAVINLFQFFYLSYWVNKKKQDKVEIIIITPLATY